MVGLLDWDERVFSKVVESISQEKLVKHIRAKSVKCLFIHRCLQRLPLVKALWEKDTVNHSKSLVDYRTNNHIDGIEGFWSYAKRISKYHFLLPEGNEYRFNHRRENLFKWFLKINFIFRPHYT